MKTRKVFLGGMVLLAFLVYGCATVTFEEMKVMWLKPENNKFKLEPKMAAKDVPHREQSFLYCEGYGVKDKILSIYTKPMSVVVLPIEKNKKIWVREEIGNSKYEWSLTLDLEAGQSYWLTDPLWEERMYGQGRIALIPLNEEGIKSYTEKMWNKNWANTAKNGLFPYGTNEDWESYEEYHQFVTQLWQIRKEETNKQLK